METLFQRRFDIGHQIVKEKKGGGGIRISLFLKIFYEIREEMFKHVSRL